MMYAKINNISLCILCKMNKSCAAVFNNISYQFLNYAEHKKFLFISKPFAIIMKTRTCINRSRSVYFFKKIFYSRLQAEIF